MKIYFQFLFFVMVGCALVMAPAAQGRDLDEVKRERNLEKRARKALEYAREKVDNVLNAYREGDVKQGETLLAEIEDAVELAKQSLKETGKNPYKKPKPFKHAEIATRRLLRELGSIEKELLLDERGPINALRDRISEINEEFLMAVMSKKND